MVSISVLGAVVIVAGCGDRGNAPLLRAFSALAVFQYEQAFEAERPSRPMLTRAQANAVPGALILVKLEGGGRADPMVAVAANGTRVTYANAARQQVTLDGAQIVRTGGLGSTISNYASERPTDAVVSPMPVAEWTDTTRRIYTFRDAFNDEFVRAALCRRTSLVAETIEIVEVTYDLIRIDETCRTPFHTFENVYWVQSDTGQIWKTVQWTGPEAPRLEVSVVTPFGPAR